MTNIRLRIREYVLVVSALIVPAMGCSTSQTVSNQPLWKNSSHKEVAGQTEGGETRLYSVGESPGVRQSQHREVADSSGNSSVSGQKVAASNVSNPANSDSVRQQEIPKVESASSGTRQSQQREVADASGNAGRPLPPPQPSGVSPNSGVQRSEQRETADGAGLLTNTSTPPGKSGAQAVVLNINSLPDGAEILLSGTVDGAYLPCKRGDQQLLTPARLDRLPSGEWWVKVRKAGYKESEPKLVKLESTTEVISVTFELVALAK
jgi:hypothetical protein